MAILLGLMYFIGVFVVYSVIGSNVDLGLLANNAFHVGAGACSCHFAMSLDIKKTKK